MDHQKIYTSIITNAKLANRNKLKKSDSKYIYYENHHIIPKCMKGTNDNDNLVLLTAREHFVCHKLLTYIYKSNYSLIYAFHRMCFSRKNHIKLSSRDYAYIRELIKSIPKDNSGEKNPMFGKKHSNKTKEKIGLKSIGRLHNHTDENKLNWAKLAIERNKNIDYYEKWKKTLKIGKDHPLVKCIGIFDNNNQLIYYINEPIRDFLSNNNLPKVFISSYKNNTELYTNISPWVESRLINNGNIKYKNWYARII